MFKYSNIIVLDVVHNRQIIYCLVQASLFIRRQLLDMQMFKFTKLHRLDFLLIWCSLITSFTSASIYTLSLSISISLYIYLYLSISLSLCVYNLSNIYSTSNLTILFIYISLFTSDVILTKYLVVNHMLHLLSFIHSFRVNLPFYWWFFLYFH